MSSKKFAHTLAPDVDVNVYLTLFDTPVGGRVIKVDDWGITVQITESKEILKLDTTSEDWSFNEDTVDFYPWNSVLMVTINTN